MRGGRGRALAAGVLLGCLVLAVIATASPAQDEPAPEVRSLIKSTHSRLVFDKPFERVAVGDVGVLNVETISNRELLLQGIEVGRTSLLVWFSDGTVKDFRIQVERDLTALQAILAQIHPGIHVEMAPDRDAVVLFGVVPDITYSRAAEAAARSYIEAGGRAQKGAALPLLQGREPADRPVREAPEEGKEEVRVEPGERTQASSVINLLQLEKLPPRPEDRLADAIAEMPGADVTVRRISRGEVPDDENDIFVLEGTVDNQVTLARVLSLANGVITGKATAEQSIQVVADESGALLSGGEGGFSRGTSAISGLGGVGGLTGGGSTGVGQALYNQVEQNLGRAKVVELANGRILSFIKVKDIPQVRVDVRLYEVNRSKLFNFNSNLDAILSDFDQPSLNPAARADAIQGDEAVRVGSVSPTDVQNVLSFLSGSLLNQFQLSGEHFALDSTMSLLESQGVARTLSRPSLSVLSGELAFFSVGGEIPITQNVLTDIPGGQGGSSTILSDTVFRSFGIELGIRPLVGEAGEIVLDLIPSISFPDAQLTAQIADSTGTDLATSAFESRVLRTSARLHDGQALLVGGLISRTSTRSNSSTPWFSDIPLLGWLFRSRATTDEDLDLIIVVNPAIVRDPLPGASLWCYPAPLELVRPPAAPSPEEPASRRGRG